MSVREVEKDEWASVACTLKAMSDSIRHVFYSAREERGHQVFNRETDPGELYFNSVNWFIDRLQIANQTALQVQYNKDGKVEYQRLEESDLIRGSRLTTKELYDLLGNIDYNTVTNAGRCFLGAEDSERIDRLREALASEIVSETPDVAALV